MRGREFFVEQAARLLNFFRQSKQASRLFYDFFTDSRCCTEARIARGHRYHLMAACHIQASGAVMCLFDGTHENDGMNGTDEILVVRKSHHSHEKRTDRRAKHRPHRKQTR